MVPMLLQLNNTIACAPRYTEKHTFMHMLQLNKRAIKEATR